ncbi:hypothetical protein A3F03_00605 [Candidatus Roizmanbacteria bacterium RIFCSPHIGHO2_12_FULL_41_11]|uniref:Glycosyltransferase 2-like domain-containing protein n=2 Tax=Candidatus Roizmaniibacteriota TaxID=1752723 RepID=A0A1F7JAJ0_9BACT|nr:MAG: hypothetical protein A3F03_00605 [Candidatus Roizmanbacteria bacterium RIFCSPHIGHO2_12_FULL_41_11]OGK52619.1 MAG: hypothetical protein A2966_02135 [Candidatus Roizmanbacteria bacterium RIFCSPLOWO2_01_FULL_41_22]
MPHQLALLTVVYENYQVLDDFLRSLEKQTNRHFELFIADASAHKKKLTSNALPVTKLSIANRGYAYAINIALKEAIKKGLDNFCVLNDDTQLSDNFVEKAIDVLQKHKNTLIGGKIYYAPGYEYHKNRYRQEEKGKVIWYAGGRIEWSQVLTLHLGVDEVDAGQFARPGKTEFITGCLVCFDKKVVDKIGFWDENYFLYYEDADYCLKAKNAGIDLYYDPQLIIWHKHAQSTQGSGSKLHEHYQKLNQLRFGLKYAPWKTKVHLLKNYLGAKLLGR